MKNQLNKNIPDTQIANLDIRKMLLSTLDELFEQDNIELENDVLSKHFSNSEYRLIQEINSLLTPNGAIEVQENKLVNIETKQFVNILPYFKLYLIPADNEKDYREKLTTAIFNNSYEKQLRDKRRILRLKYDGLCKQHLT